MGAVAEAQHELALEFDAAALAHDDAHEMESSPLRGGMKSIRVATPSAVSKRVSRMSVLPR